LPYSRAHFIALPLACAGPPSVDRVDERSYLGGFGHGPTGVWQPRAMYCNCDATPERPFRALCCVAVGVVRSRDIPLSSSATCKITQSCLTHVLCRYAMDADAIADVDTPGIPNPPRYKDNRHDQSIWNLIVHKYGLKVRLSSHRSVEPTCSKTASMPPPPLFLLSG
jgi:hypothetical protein